MKTLLKYTLPVFAVAGLLTSCEPELEAPAASAGNADFSKYVALGNSLTAGYADNALYREGQEASYTNILAQQFKLVGGGDFSIPYVPQGESYGAPVATPAGLFVPTRLVLGMSTPSCGGAASLGPKSQGPAQLLANQFNPQSTPSKFNNLGVPGAKSVHLIAENYGNQAGLPTLQANPFFVRMATSPSTSILKDAIAQNPTFFSLWIGNNDVLGYATSGGTGDVGDPLENDGNDITATPVFQFAIDSLTRSLTSGGAKGVIANIPSVTSVPFFTTIPYNGLVLSRQGQVDSLNAGYAPLGITFSLGQNGFVIQDGGAPRKMVAGELVLLTVSDSLRCQGYGSARPIPDKFVLTAEEISNINTATTTFNSILKTIADAKGLAFADMNQYMQSLNPVLYTNGVANSAAFVTGNVFSLDGVHLTPRGNALVANEFIRAINRKYNSSIPEVNPAGYPGVRFP